MTYTVTYGRWALVQGAGGLVGTGWIAWGTLRAGDLAYVPGVAIVLGAIWWLVLRMLVTRIDLTGRTLVVRTPVRTVRLSADEVTLTVPRTRFWYSYLRGPEQMRGFELPSTEGTRELARLIRES